MVQHNFKNSWSGLMIKKKSKCRANNGNSGRDKSLNFAYGKIFPSF